MKPLFLLLICLFAVVQCVPMSTESMTRSLAENLVDCHNSDFFTCLKEKALKVAERLRTVRKLNIFDGVTIINNEPRQARSLEPLPAESEARGLAVNQRLWDSTSAIIQSTDLEISYSPDDDDDEEESKSLDNEVDEGRNKKKKAIKKKLKILIPLLILAKVKAAAITVLAVVVMAASLFKLATIAKIAFLVKIIGIIKALLAKKHAQQESWEVPHGWDVPHVEHPHVEPAHGWDGGWSRRTEANSLAYSAYNQ
ncbi:hypothetical protein K1T71_013650 [Dendrolimus kikuchii]|uniref:Uncharacterized protein n=1 Tax=Dendrolimus kikuchii TaxID=765133 RepID=A0ACC1CH83_9NEOP|nr:hypothetical protein K1T71_013650 [Dendrolimus kikuchii]